VLDTAYRILMSEGLGRLSIDRVAAESGVSKPTIYRSWTNAQELAMAAFMAQPQLEAPARDGSSARNALAAHLLSVIETFATQRGRQITLTMASADPDSELSKAFRNQVILKSREAGRRLIQQAAAAHQLRPDINVEAVLDMLYGPLFFRLLVGHLPLPPQLAEQLVDTLFHGIHMPQ
jgi:AcrR family transcriptional regulator